tara:strand:- start:365 stop:1078 length:714 start_codon:yes stop_codon:yes gene_type:complete
MSSLIYINSRNSITEYPTHQGDHPLSKFAQERVIQNRDRPESMAGNIIPRPQGNTFWGRIASYDHLSVKRMLKKEPALISIKWCDLDPVCSLFHRGSYLFRVSDSENPEAQARHQKRFLKMLRLLVDHGCVVNSETLTPYIERYHFFDEEFAKKTLRCLLHRGLNLSNYSLLEESEVMLLEKIKFERNETFVFWGRKVISDHIRLEKRKLLHVYLRDLVPNKIVLCYDVIGVITSFI